MREQPKDLNQTADQLEQSYDDERLSPLTHVKPAMRISAALFETAFPTVAARRGGLRPGAPAFARHARAGHKDAVPTPASPPALFDRALLAARLERAYRAAPANPGADFLLRRAAEELADRLSLVRRVFAVAADVGSPGPHAAEALAARSGGALTLRLAPSPLGVGRGAYSAPSATSSACPWRPKAAISIVSLMALHHVNDLPGALIQIRRALRPDGLFLAALAGGDTLTELRQSLTIAESEILGGAGAARRPFRRRARAREPDAARRLRAAGGRRRSCRRAL